MKGPDRDIRKPIQRPVVSELDGTREGGLVFCVALMLGMVIAAAFVPSALTSFWVWVALLSMAIGLAVNTQRFIARRSGMAEAQAEDQDR